MQTISHGLPSSPSGWFASKSNEGGTESYTPSYHARSTTAVDSASASGASRVVVVWGCGCSSGFFSECRRLDPYASFSTLEYLPSE